MPKGSEDLTVRAITDSSVVWLGAGFSAAISDGKLPLMRGFFAGLDSRRYPLVARYLSASFASIDVANIEVVLQQLDQAVKATGLYRGAARAMLAGIDPVALQEEVENYVIDRLDLSLDKFSQDNWAAALALQIDHTSSVITTNYDTLADRFLASRVDATHCRSDATCHHCVMRGILSEKCGCESDYVVPDGTNGALLKIHGSISWRTCTNSGCSSYDCISSSCDFKIRRPSLCPCCGSRSRPVLVLPSMVKDYSRFVELRRMWQHAADALKKCRCLTIVGFSFPQSDCAVCALVAEALCGNQHIEEINIIDRSAEDIATRAKELLHRRPDVPIKTWTVPREPGASPVWAGSLVVGLRKWISDTAPVAA